MTRTEFQHAIAIAMPVYNGIRFINQAINSIQNQTDPNWLLFISDNASTDGTIQLLKDLEHSYDSRIKIYFQKKNLGIYGNLNYLTSVINYNFIHILCADDQFSDPNALKRLRLKLPFNNSVGAVRWNSTSKDCVIIPGQESPVAAQLYFALHGNPLGNLSNITYKKSALQDCGMFDTNYPFVGDFATWANIALRYNIILYPETIVNVRQHEHSASNYLNEGGELYLETSDLLLRLLRNVVSQTMCDALILRITLSVVYDSQYRFSAVIKALRGNSTYLRTLDIAGQKNSFILNVHLLWMVAVLTLGGRLFKSELMALTMKRYEKAID